MRKTHALVQVAQSEEFTLRAQVLRNIDILRSACSVNAALIGEAGNLGCIREGSVADLLLVDGDPLTDISLLARAGDSLAIIMQSGRFHKRIL